MKQISEEQVLVTQETVVSVTCDCCGKIEYKDYCGSDITPVQVEFGYGSRFDTSAWCIDVCDDCIEKWVSTFKNKITKSSGW